MLSTGSDDCCIILYSLGFLLSSSAILNGDKLRLVGGIDRGVNSFICDMDGNCAYTFCKQERKRKQVFD